MDFLADFDDFSSAFEPQFEMNEDSNQMTEDLPTSKKSKQTRRKPRRRKRMLTGVSKQRRAANERERRRLQIINSAFIGLKDLLPLLPGEENISKIEVVKLASRTILLLKEILDDADRKSSGSESDELRSSCSSSTCGSSLDSLESLDTNNDLDLQESQDFSFLLFPSDDIRLDPFGESVDSGLSIPSPCISDSSCTSSSRESSEFPFLEDDPLRDDVFYKGPTMCLW